MACELRIWFMASILPLILASNLKPSLVHAEPQVPCYFIFGDSLVDNGNNNELATTARANYPPYGVDFSNGHPTGRFSNGRNMADFIAELLGFSKAIPPFATARGQEILTGVNYGSGAAGIRDETGQQMGDRISLNQQLVHHQITISHIASLLGSEEAAADYLSKCLYSVGMGNNDYINNYLLPDYYPTSTLYTPDQFAAVLIEQYSLQLTKLYEYGARKLALFGLGLIGCTPAEIATYGTTNGSACVDTINNDVQLFNLRLASLVDELNGNLTDAKFIYINMTEISSGNSSEAGITEISDPCCIVSSNMGKGQCMPDQVPCRNRRTYAFWDAFHPTEVASFLVSTRAYSAQSPLDAYPFDIRSLALSPSLSAPSLVAAV